MSEKNGVEFEGWLLNEITRRKVGKIIGNPNNPIVDELECAHDKVCEIVMCYLKKCEEYQRVFAISFAQSDKEFREYRSCSLDEVGLATFLGYVSRRARFVWKIDPEITANQLIEFKKRLEKICTDLLRNLDSAVLQHYQQSQQVFGTNEM